MEGLRADAPPRLYFLRIHNRESRETQSPQNRGRSGRVRAAWRERFPNGRRPPCIKGSLPDCEAGNRSGTPQRVRKSKAAHNRRSRAVNNFGPVMERIIRQKRDNAIAFVRSLATCFSSSARGSAELWATIARSGSGAIRDADRPSGAKLAGGAFGSMRMQILHLYLLRVSQRNLGIKRQPSNGRRETERRVVLLQRTWRCVRGNGSDCDVTHTSHTSHHTL